MESWFLIDLGYGPINLLAAAGRNLQCQFWPNSKNGNDDALVPYLPETLSRSHLRNLLRQWTT